MIFSWLFNRRKQLLHKPLNGKQLLWVQSNVWHWQVLHPHQRQRLSGLINLFVAEKNFEGCDGLRITDEMKVTIAAAACLLLLGFEDGYCFDRAGSILVYPRPTVQRNLKRIDGIVDEWQWLSGMAQQGGPIVLSWRDVLHDCRNESNVRNVVVHEFAHYIDGLDGAMEGQPPLPTADLQERWKSVASRELEQLRQSARSGNPTVLDSYGAQNPAEFFAVATEAFFCDGQNLYVHHRDLYDLLALLYKVETRSWFNEASETGDI